MARCRVDKSIDRVEIKGFPFPLGVYPIEPMEPRAGYTVTFEPADGSSEGGGSRGAEADDEPDDAGGGLADGEGAGGEDDWEEWPDRYVYDILVPATRVEALCRSLFALLPGRVYPILDVLGQDEYREVDPYVSYDLIGLERFLDAVRRFSGFFYEDGLVGFGVMCEEPFLYIFIDEHKIVTVRAETALREKVESVLTAFDLEVVDEIAGADAATHEHRGVLDAPEDRPDMLNAEEIVEYLRDEWRLVLNIDPERNLDDEGADLGITGWRCVVRHDWDLPVKPSESDEPAATGAELRPIGRYAEVFLTASCFREAEDLALEAFRAQLPSSLRKIWEQDEDAPDVPMIVAADRLTPEHFAEDVRSVRAAAAAGGAAGSAKPEEPTFTRGRTWAFTWLPLEPGASA